MPAGLSAQDLAKQHARRRAAAAAIAFELVVDLSRAALRRRVDRSVLVRLPNKPRRPHSTLFFVRRPCAFDPRPRFPVTKVAPLVARHRGHFKKIVREELCVLGGRLTSIVAADAKSYDSRVT